ncbi:hypothetical protein [Sulfitobacter sp. S190]|uniref:hypothetical protein n=1 Tax=Sulfitobacter sp. S190 TaxID=2867022 RepID=UPI0021A7EA15|nr:hypothetical protein [Sulfitobacter sp. S190]UWR23723.1 hypothetical protein K3756_07115 [Sulfitobacter sp. S190]
MDDPFADIVDKWPRTARARFAAVRALVLRAARDAEVGPLDESLKWGQPAWRPRRPRQGSTLRMSYAPATPDRINLFVDCKTNLADTVRQLYPDDFTFKGNRLLALSLTAPLPAQAIGHLAVLTFTYHRRDR